MNNYFLFTWKHRSELASAFATKEVQLDYELISELEGLTSIPFEFELKKITEGKDGLIVNNDLATLKETWLDYQPNNLAWPLMSEKLKSIIIKNLTGNEGVNWLTVKVNAGSEQRIYYIMRFEKKMDVLDLQKTTFVKSTDHIIRPVFSISKISSYNIFHKPLSHSLWQITSALYISDVLKKAIQKEKITGVDFEKATVG